MEGPRLADVRGCLTGFKGQAWASIPFPELAGTTGVV